MSRLAEALHEVNQSPQFVGGEVAAKVSHRTNPRLAMSFHSMIAPGTPQPINDGIRSGYQGPVVVGQGFTVINITPERIVTRMPIKVVVIQSQILSQY